MDEVELKFLNIDIDQIKQKLIGLGAKLIFDTQIESYSFYGNGFHISDSKMKYLRVRKVNDEVTITYKSPTKESEMSNRKEIEIKVDDFDKAISLIEKMGLNKDKIFKKNRSHYELKNIHFELDTLENIPTFLEIETQTEQEMKEICLKLKLNISEGRKGTIVEILPEMFNK